MKQTLALGLFITVIFQHLTAHAWPTRQFILCHAFLSSAYPFHGDASRSAEQTEEAVSFLSQFLERQGAEGVRPSFGAGSYDSTARLSLIPGKRDRAFRRVQGIVEHSRIHAESGGNDLVLASMILRPDDLEAFRREFETGMKQGVGEWLDRSMHVVEPVGIVMSSYFWYHFIKALLLTEISAGALGFLAFGNLLPKLALIYTRGVDFDWDGRTGSDWAASSWNLKMRRGFLDKAWSEDGIDARLLETMMKLEWMPWLDFLFRSENWNILDSIGTARPGEDGPPSKREGRRYHWLGVDTLWAADPETGEPVTVVTIRFSRNRVPFSDQGPNAE